MAEKRRTPGIERSGSTGSLGDVALDLSYGTGLVPAAPERRTRAATDRARPLVAVGDAPVTSVQMQPVVRTEPLTTEPALPLDGRGLYGERDHAELPLPDDLRPDAATHRRIGKRFAELAFAKGPFVTSTTVPSGLLIVRTIRRPDAVDSQGFGGSGVLYLLGACGNHRGHSVASPRAWAWSGNACGQPGLRVRRTRPVRGDLPSTEPARVGHVR